MDIDSEKTALLKDSLYHEIRIEPKQLTQIELSSLPSPSPPGSEGSFGSEEIAAHLQEVDCAEEEEIEGANVYIRVDDPMEMNNEEMTQMLYWSVKSKPKLASWALSPAMCGDLLEEGPIRTIQGINKSCKLKSPTKKNEGLIYTFPTVTQETWSRMSKNTFICDGRLMVGTDVSYFAITNALIFVIGLLYFGFMFSFFLM
ncbi:hypothetical protein RFI_22804 [Reticulomyxa filosa]|uniref:Uncharacterized protein n=1 Tax=Reticulomyxa filosa TaxID=46433 RepID=X6ML31_RETFI|nr:hypothetical protein RFI_22804 [Reticulomyxa filosa]|eukprot:ETO14564.1 hypothetical protein RFI_22804 [Reticulomyxa filosa]